jgi:transposase
VANTRASAELTRLRQLLEERDRTVEAQQLEIERLKIQLARLRRWKFGRSSEQLDLAITQIELTLDALQAVTPEVTTAPAATAAVRAPVPRRHRPVRRALPAHLPRETLVHQSPEVTQGCGCSSCGGTLRKLGEDVAEVLEFVPGSFKVIRHVREKHACRGCSRIVQPFAPSRPIERGLAGPALLAHIVNSKYGHHLPLYRQSEIYARAGMPLDRSTLAQWVAGSCRLLAPLVLSLERYVLSAQKIHADDTSLPVLDPGRGCTKRGHLWSYVRDDRGSGGRDPPAVWFAYSPDRKGVHPQHHLRGFAGLLQTDAYAGFDAIAQRGPRKSSATDRGRRVLCLGHARRHFHDLHVAVGSPVALEALQRIGELYHIECEIKGCTPQERYRVRQVQAVPRLQALHAWLSNTLSKTSRSSALAKAIRYTTKSAHWPALTYYCEDGRAEIDNLAVERQIRPVALGRGNYLFAGSDTGGERAAVAYSLIGTARLNAVDPESYLRHVLQRIADHPINRVQDLLPWNVPLARTAEHSRKN